MRDPDRSTTAREVAEAWLDAVGARDVDAALALSDPSIVYVIEPVIRYEGHQGVRDLVEDFGRLAGFVSITLLAVVEAPGVVAIRRTEKYALPTGVLDLHSCGFVEVSGGRVTRWSDHKNLGMLDKVAGL